MDMKTAQKNWRIRVLIVIPFEELWTQITFHIEDSVALLRQTKPRPNVVIAEFGRVEQHKEGISDNKANCLTCAAANRLPLDILFWEQANRPAIDADVLCRKQKGHEEKYDRQSQHLRLSLTVVDQFAGDTRRCEHEHADEKANRHHPGFPLAESFQEKWID